MTSVYKSTAGLDPRSSDLRSRGPDLGVKWTPPNGVVPASARAAARSSTHTGIPRLRPLGPVGLGSWWSPPSKVKQTPPKGVQTGSKYDLFWVDLGSKRDTPKWGGPEDERDGPPGQHVHGIP